MADASQYKTAKVVHELLDELHTLDTRFFEGPNALTDDQSVLEGYKWIFSLLQVALDTQVWADPANPRFVEIVGPYKKWGGDNSDAYYLHAPIDPDVTYKVTGDIGDACYLSLTVYGGPRDGHYSERIVGTVNDRDHLDIGPDGSFELMMARERPDGWDGPFLALEDDAVVAITRDYLEQPFTRNSVPVAHRGHRPAGDGEGGRRRPRPSLHRRTDLGARPEADGAPRARRAEPDRRALPRARGDVRVGRRGCLVRDGQLRPRGRRGARHQGPLAGVRVLELLPVEPVPAHVQLRLRAGDDQRRAGAVRGRRFVGDRRRARATRACRTGCRPRATRAVASGSAGSTRRRRPSDRPARS